MAITERYVTAAAAGGGDGSEGNPWTLAEALANVAKNERLNIKADSTYDITSAIDFTNSGDTDEPILVRGYSSTIGDGGKPILSFTSGGRIACTASHVHYSDLRINGSATSGTPLFKLSTSEATLYNVDVDGSDQTTSHVINIDGYGILCRVSVKGGSGSTLVYGGASVTACSFSGGSTGLDTSGSVIMCQFRGMATAIDLSVSNKRSTVAFNTFYDVGTAFYASNTPATGDCSVIIANNLMYSISDYGINNDSLHAQIFLLVNNAMGAVTSGRINGFGDIFEHNPIILTADPFVNAANGDLRLNEEAGGGELCRGTAMEAPELL
jgi:hypothetical protein